MLSKEDVNKGLRLSILEGGFATVHMSLTTGTFLTGFAILLGSNDFEIALLLSIPLLTQLIQIFAVNTIERYGKRKHISAWTAVLSRSLWLLLVIIPFLSISVNRSIQYFIIIFTLSNLLLSYSGVAWLSWMADLVPPDIRGRYFGKRNMILGFISIVVTLLASKILDEYKIKNLLANGFLVVEIIAVISAIIGFIFLLKQPEPEYKKNRSQSLRANILTPLKTYRFRKLLLFYLFWTFAIGVASNYHTVFLLNYLKWSFSKIALLNIGISVITMCSQPVWGRIIDKVGHKPVIKLTVLCIIPIPLVYFFSTPLSSWPIWLDVILSGIIWSGFNLAIFNIVFYSLPDDGRLSFIAVQSSLTGLVSFVSIVFGGVIAYYFANFNLVIFDFTITNYHLLFLLTVFLRFVSFPLIKYLDEPTAKPVGEMIFKIISALNRRMGFSQS